MRLPAGGFHELLASHAARSLQQFEHFRGLATVAGRGLGTLGFLRAFWRFLGRAGLLPRLGGLAGATFARRAPALAFFLALVAMVSVACSVSVCSVFDVMIRSPLAVITA